MADDLFANIEIIPREVKSMMERGEEFLFVDVREKWEFETSWIEGAVLVPMREIPSNLAKFEEADNIVLFCHHGIRSLDAAAWLRSQDVAGAKSMAGGIDRWSAEIDPNVPRY
jgi:adenylyltransferase/sulfurtransferase